MSVPVLALSDDECAFARACSDWGAFYLPYGEANPEPMWEEMKRYFASELKLREPISRSLKSQIESYRTGPRVGYGAPSSSPTRTVVNETYSYAPGHGNLVYDAYCIQLSSIARTILAKLDRAFHLQRQPTSSGCWETLSPIHYNPSSSTFGWWRRWRWWCRVGCAHRLGLPHHPNDRRIGPAARGSIHWRLGGRASDARPFFDPRGRRARVRNKRSMPFSCAPRIDSTQRK